MTWTLPRRLPFPRPSLALLAWALAALGAVIVLGDVALRLLADQAALPELAKSEAVDLLDNLATLGLLAIGGLVAAQRPSNLLGWLFLTAGLGLALGNLGTIYAARALVVDQGSLPAGRFVGWLSNWTWAAGVGTLPFLTLLFPTGRVPSPRWRPALWASCALYVVLLASAIAFASAIWDQPLTPDDELPSSTESSSCRWSSPFLA